ncbi:MAG: trypsin-like peptidase domain-containing protein, partial [Candidatus Rokubacteria bacterium]|nr:trypsin-like peptidase domain-containing protein [Candidatus Rokubacteria bacterium]
MAMVAAFCAGPAVAALPVEKLAPGVAFLRRDDTKDSPAGTGFFIASAEKLYLVTASHVSRMLSLASPITISTAAGRPFTFPLGTLLPKSEPPKWVHAQADVAVLRISPSPEFLKTNLAGHFLPSSWLEKAKQAPLRAITLTVLGFPLQLGVSEFFSPISRETKAASGLLELPRFDTKVMSTFFLTQDPSVGGFSGAPVFDTRLPHSTGNIGLSVQIGAEPRIVGLVHGTLSDNTGGKFGAIVPAFIIVELLDQT